MIAYKKKTIFEQCVEQGLLIDKTIKNAPNLLRNIESQKKRIILFIVRNSASLIFSQTLDV
jgi:hypothetical protein